MTALVEVVAVEVSELEHDGLWGFGIDQPKSGSERSTYSLVVRGWALGRGAPVQAVELTRDGIVLRRLALAGNREDIAAVHPDVEGARNCEFFAAISSLALAPTFELVVQAVLSDQSIVKLGAISGKRAPLRTRFEPRLAPLMLTSTGRVGSTVMMNAFAAHPQIAVYPPFRKEPRVVSYWMEVFATLSEPASYIRQLAPGGALLDRWWLGSGEPMPRTAARDEVEHWMAGEAVETLAAFCQGRIEALYEEIAASNGKPDATYFAEKTGTDSVPVMMWELYPAAREVFLVRDFRDVACSILASSAKRKGLKQVADPSTVLRDILGRTETIVRAWEERSAQAHLVRYEDLIRGPVEVLEGLARYLDVDSRPELVEAMVDALSEEGAAAKQHRTAPDAEASIGRWRHDLDEETQREFELVLRRGLETFGYELEFA